MNISQLKLTSEKLYDDDDGDDGDGDNDDDDNDDDDDNNNNNNNTRHAKYLRRNIKARSCNHCCGGKAIIIIYSECVSVALVIQHAMRMHHIVICGQHGCKIFFFTLSHKMHYSRKKNIEPKGCSDFLYKLWLKRLHSKRN